MRVRSVKPSVNRAGEGGMTLVELLVAMAIALASLGTLTYGYLQAYKMTDSVTLQAAAQRLAVERLEQVQSAQWTVHTNTLPQFAGTTANFLVLPLLTTNQVWASLTTEVESLGVNPPLYRIRVACQWTNHAGRGFTNEVTTLRAPD